MQNQDHVLSGEKSDNHPFMTDPVSPSQKALKVILHQEAPEVMVYPQTHKGIVDHHTPEPIVDFQTPKVIVYHQTFEVNGSHVPILKAKEYITHLILSAFHICGTEQAPRLELNDFPPDDQKFNRIWDDVADLQGHGVKVMGMLGGAATGTYERLGRDSAEAFQAFYTPLKEFLIKHQLNGIDIDIEEAMTTDKVIRLIDNLRRDFSSDFIITLAPVARALMSEKCFSDIDHLDLERQKGDSINWYNTQFYNGWGDLHSPRDLEAIFRRGFKPHKIVVGMISHPDIGSGYINATSLIEGLLSTEAGKKIGGVMTWEYFNALPGGVEAPWEWAKVMRQWSLKLLNELRKARRE